MYSTDQMKMLVAIVDKIILDIESNDLEEDKQKNGNVCERIENMFWDFIESFEKCVFEERDSIHIKTCLDGINLEINCGWGANWDTILWNIQDIRELIFRVHLELVNLRVKHCVIE